jgi:hypothetical protein
MNLPQSSSYIVQIIAGLIITYVIYIAALYAVNADRLATFDSYELTGKQEVKITKGVLTSSEIAAGSTNNKWNTNVSFMPNYLPIIHSVNQHGGAQFSYSFWIYVGDPVQALNKTIFMKGDRKKYEYTKQERNFNSGLDTREFGPEIRKNEVVIYCPMLSFGAEALEFDVKFNTFHKIDESMKLRRLRNDDNLKRNNLQGLFPKAWFFVSVIFEDNLSLSEFENGLMVRLYINNTLYQIDKFSTTLRQNRGDFYLFPDGPIPDCKIADLTYYNYALSDAEVKAKSEKKPNMSLNASSTGNTNKNASFDTTLRNEMDIYNI